MLSGSLDSFYTTVSFHTLKTYCDVVKVRGYGRRNARYAAQILFDRRGTDDVHDGLSILYTYNDGIIPAV